MSLKKDLPAAMQNCFQSRLGALQTAHKNLIAATTQHLGLESLDLDCCIQKSANLLDPQQRGNAANWDYVISVGQSLRRIERYDALEPHPGGADEVPKIENKKIQTEAFLELAGIRNPDRWVWIQTRTALPPNDPLVSRLAQSGIEISGKTYSL